MYNADTLIYHFSLLAQDLPNISKLWIHCLTSNPSSQHIRNGNLVLERLINEYKDSATKDLSKMNILSLYCIAHAIHY